MDLPPSALVRTLSSREVYVLRFQHAAHKDNPKPHYWIFLPVRDDGYLCFCMFTTQFQGRHQFYNRPPHGEAAVEALHYVPPGTVHFLRSPNGCLVDCNAPQLVTRPQLASCISPEKPLEVVASAADLPRGFAKELTAKIRRSPVVKPYVKRLLLDLE